MDPDESTREWQVILSSQAVQDLAGIVTFIAADNPPATERFGRALLQKTRSLATSRNRGERCLNWTPPNEHASRFSALIVSSTAWIVTADGWKSPAFGMVREGYRGFECDSQVPVLLRHAVFIQGSGP